MSCIVHVLERLVLFLQAVVEVCAHFPEVPVGMAALRHSALEVDSAPDMLYSRMCCVGKLSSCDLRLQFCAWVCP